MNFNKGYNFTIEFLNLLKLDIYTQYTFTQIEDKLNLLYTTDQETYIQIIPPSNRRHSNKYIRSIIRSYCIKNDNTYIKLNQSNNIIKELIIDLI